MNTDRLLLDTNAFIYFFEGKEKAKEIILAADMLFYSPITEIELLAAQKLSAAERVQIQTFLKHCQSVPLGRQVTDVTVEIRRQYRLKIPDAIIAASALVCGATLVTADIEFKKISGLKIIRDIA